ncbi:ice-binding family protein [Ferroplasma sp.]|uniref:ice-binding family protein n=1 Tax=Ferroplasma sp. TaxID=2591003 RepID=UPI002635209B|nr:ice-binding family protein [Ferroplasma sp.]
MNKNNKSKFILAIFVSILLILASSVLVLDSSPNSGNYRITYSPFSTGTTYNVSFDETGLTSGIQWNVTLNGVSENSTASVITFSEINGNYTYQVANLSGFSASPSSGTVTVNGANVTETITFTQVAGTSIAPINLGTAGDYTILAKTGISTTGTTSITGNIGVSPAASTYITGFALTLNSSGQFATSSLVNGNVYAATYASPTPAGLTTAVSDMQTAYTNGAGRVNPNYVNLGAGNINGMTLVPGLYKWGTGVSISSSITLTGNSSSVWIFQIAGGLTFGNGAHIILSGGVQPQNIFWVVASGVSIGTTASFYGIVLSQTDITIATGASMTGLALAQTAVTLESDTLKAPALSNSVTQQMFNVTFTETGLPTGAVWNLTLNNVLLSSSGSSISMGETNGTYAFNIVSSSSDKIYPSTGDITVSGEHAYNTVLFASPNQAVYTITAKETGLSTGIQWEMTMNGSKDTSSNSTITFFVTNGTYSYTIGNVSGYKTSTTSGTVTVNGANESLSVAYTSTHAPKSLIPGISNTELYIIVGVIAAIAIIGGIGAVMIIKKK